MRALQVAIVAFLFAVTAHAVTVSWDVPQNSTSEGNSQAGMVVVRSGGSSGVVTVDYATSSGTAVAGINFTATSGTVTFNDGETMKFVYVPILNNSTYDGWFKSFYVTLSNPTGGASIGTATTRVDIFDDDPPPDASINDISVVEGNSGTTDATFTVTMTGARSVDVSLSYYTTPLTASDPSDYQYRAGTLTFAPGDTQKTITVPVNGDTVYEADEIFYVGITSSVARVRRGLGSCTIVNDDPPPSITAADVSVVEGNFSRHNAVITLQASQPLNGVSINYSTVDGTAVSGRDFDFQSGSVSFSGETQKQIAIPIIADTDVEPDQQFTVHLSASCCVSLPHPNVTVTILNDDRGVGPATQDVAKGSSTSVVADAGNPPPSPQTLAVAVTDPCIAAPSSVTLTSRTVSIPVQALDAPCSANVEVTFPAALGGGTYSAGIRTYNVALPAPAISAVAPAFGSIAGGTTVKISGRDFTPACWAFFDGIAARNVTLLGSTLIVATAPAHAAATVPVSLRCGAAGDASMDNGFNYSVAEEPPPVITAVDPLAASPGQTVTIAGTRFRPTDSVTFDSTPARLLTPLGNGDTHEVVLPSLPPGKVSVNVTDATGRLSTTGPIFTVLEAIPPQVTTVSPASVPAGGELTIDGRGFRTPYSFALGDAAARTVTMSFTRATVRVPALPPGTYALHVLDGSGQAAAAGGNVIVTATGVVVTGVSPACATNDGHATIAITGSGFAGGATVTIAGVVATNANVVDPTHITATVPEIAPGWSTITVTNPGDGSGSATNALRVYSPWDPDGCGVSPRPRPVQR